MASKNLYLNIVYRCCLILVVSLATGWLVFDLNNYILAALSLLTAGILLGSLIRFLNGTNRRIAFFFEAIINEDSSLHIPGRSGNRALDELNQSIVKLNELIKKVLIDQQQQEQYFQAILEQVPVGVITFDDSGMIFLSNKAARKQLHYEHLNHIRQLERIDRQLYTTLTNIRPGDRKLVKIKTSQGDVQLSLGSTLFKTTQDKLQLVAIQDIRTELDKTEVDSWIKLIRVLTHEIMNTIAPITSLSESLLENYKTDEELTEKTIKNTVKGLEVINDRGKGLMSFVESYRKLTRLPDPVMKPMPVKKLFDKIITLVKLDPGCNDIPVIIKVQPDDLEILADEKQVSQVLINLFKNSLEALNRIDQGKIALRAFINTGGRPQLMVSDNGPGIPENNLDKIFIPFFTTKEAGSGIGLSLSRQIMQNHGGSLTAHSVPGRHTSMVMVF